MATLGLVSPEPGRPTLSLVQVKLGANGQKVDTVIPFFSGELGRIRDLCIAPDGRVFLVTSNRDGRHWPSYERFASDRIIEIRPPADSTWIASAPLANARLCAGDTLTIPFSAGGRFRGGNRFVAELSDAHGSFEHPLIVGTSTPIGGAIDSLAGALAVAIPDSIAGGTGYSLRVASLRPAGIPAVVATEMTITPRPHPELRDSVGVLHAAPGFLAYRWHVDDAPIDAVEGDSWIPRRSGTYWVEVVDSLGCLGISNVVEVQVSSAPVAMLPAASVRLLPQPAGDRLVVELSLEHAGSVEVTVTDATGTLVREASRSAEPGALRIELPFDELPSGLYLVEVRTPAGRWSGKVVRQ
jgi:hypothetical protein